MENPNAISVQSKLTVKKLVLSLPSSIYIEGNNIQPEKEYITDIGYKGPHFPSAIIKQIIWGKLLHLCGSLCGFQSLKHYNIKIYMYRNATAINNIMM